VVVVIAHTSSQRLRLPLCSAEIGREPTVCVVFFCFVLFCFCFVLFCFSFRMC
jgi:hypothetical protein